MKALLLFLLAALTHAREPVVLFPTAQLSGVSSNEGIGFAIEIPDGYSVYATFSSDSPSEDDPCSTSLSQHWSRVESAYLALFSSAEIMECTHNSAESGEFQSALRVWYSRSGEYLAMKSLPFSWDGKDFEVATDSPATFELSDLSWAPSGVTIIEVAYISADNAIASATLESSVKVELLGVTVMRNESNGYEQRIHFVSPSGALRENDQVSLILDNGQEIIFTLQLALSLGELMPNHGSVEMLTFKDISLKQPYISSYLSGESIAEGGNVCVVVQDVTGSAIDISAARICSSPSQLFTPDGGCSTSPAPDVQTLSIFDRSVDYVNAELHPEIRDTASRSQSIFCFKAVKLSENVHLLEVELVNSNNQQKRHWGSWSGNHTDGFWFHCADGHHWDWSLGHCQSGFNMILWGAFAVIVLVAIFVCCLCYNNGNYWGDNSFFGHASATSDNGYASTTVSTGNYRYQQAAQQTVIARAESPPPPEPSHHKKKHHKDHKKKKHHGHRD